jgi:hypothetical protein
LFLYKENNFVSLTQGKFVEGKLEGFGRVIDAKGSAQMGFYSTKMSTMLRGGKAVKIKSDDNLVSRPFGKWMHVDKNMKILSGKGIYRGDEREWNRLITPSSFKDFIKNEEPSLAFG